MEEDSDTQMIKLMAVMITMMMTVTVTVTVMVTVIMTIFQCGLPGRGRGLEEVDAGPGCQSSKAKWSFCHHGHYDCHGNHCHVLEVINSTGKGDFLAVFNRDVSSDETLRTAFQKQYVLMCMNDANQDDHDSDLE